MKNQFCFYKKAIAAIFFIVTFGLAGCAQDQYGDVYDVSETRTAQTVHAGTITKLTAVTISGGDGAGSIFGSIAGGVVGSLIGSQIGGGVGKDIATIGGGVAGAALGSKVAEGAEQKPGVNIVIKLDSGETVSVIQQVDPKVFLSIGQRVNIYKRGETARVVPVK